LKDWDVKKKVEKEGPGQGLIGGVWKGEKTLRGKWVSSEGGGGAGLA